MRSDFRKRIQFILSFGPLKLLALLLLAVFLPRLGPAQFTYEVNNGTITITGYDCSGYGLTIPSNIDGLPVTGIGYRAFAGCQRLIVLTVAGNVTNIAPAAFDGCTSLTSVTLGDDVSSAHSATLTIGDRAFNGCANVAELVIGNNVNSIGYNAFQNCSSLTNLVIPDSVTYIGEQAFFSCRGLTNVAIGNGLGAISDSTFYGCTKLANVVFGSGLRRIGAYAFHSSASLAVVNLPANLTDIGTEAFRWCTGLTQIEIPGGVTNIGPRAFQSCSSLDTIAVSSENQNYSSLDGVLFDKAQRTLIEFPGGRNGSYSIPVGVASIQTEAFAECRILKEAIIPDTVTYIGASAFFYCEGLERVTLPNGVKAVLNGTFTACKSLKEIKIPDTVTQIGADAFQSCLALSSANLGTSLTYIGNQAFYSCKSLATITIPKTVGYIGDLAFYYCDIMTGIYFEGSPPAAGFIGGPVRYYLPGMPGWGPNYAGNFTAPWVLDHPVIIGPTSHSLKVSPFGFVVSWATNTSVVIETATGVINSTWTPLSTNTLVNGWTYFSDPQWSKFTARFYRVHSQ